MCIQHHDPVIAGIGQVDPVLQIVINIRQILEAAYPQRVAVEHTLLRIGGRHRNRFIVIIAVNIRHRAVVDRVTVERQRRKAG